MHCHRNSECTVTVITVIQEAKMAEPLFGPQRVGEILWSYETMHLSYGDSAGLHPSSETR